MPGNEFTWNGEKWCLPDPDIKQGNKITFGEFLEAKTQMNSQFENNEEREELLKENPEDLIIPSRISQWHMLLPLSAIFLRKTGEEFEEKFLFENSERLTLMQELPVSIALKVGEFFNLLNERCNEFPCFKDGVGSSGSAMKAHYKHMGYVRFLKDIALTHVFDVPGSAMNSIQALRKAPLFDVLLYASEEKMYAEAKYIDEKEEIKRNTK